MSPPSSPTTRPGFNAQEVAATVVHAGAWTNETRQQVENKDEEQVVLVAHSSAADVSWQNVEKILAEEVKANKK